MTADPVSAFRAVLPPLEGVMTPWFIEACSELNLVPLWITPFLSVTGGSVPSKAVLRRRLEPYVRSGKKTVVQIMGRDAEDVALCAARLAETGIPAGINLNFACPSPTVNRSGSGAALLADPGRVFRIVRSVRNILPEELPLSVKLRSGFREVRTEESVRASVEGGAGLILFHYRTAAEMYSPAPDSAERISRAVQAAEGIPVYGNGDIRTCEDAETMIRETGCSGVAAARGFLADPGLLIRINGGTPPEDTDLKAWLKRRNAPFPLVRELERLADF